MSTTLLLAVALLAAATAVATRRAPRAGAALRHDPVAADQPARLRLPRPGRAAEHRRALERALPDTLDQLTVAVEAGLGFDAALARVAARGDGPLAVELRRTLHDVQLGMSRSDALALLAERSGSPDLRRFAAATRQSERYGVPLATVLRTQAGELRERRRQRAEERAMKLPVKVLFPLVLCILPTLFIVVLGPAVIRYSSGGGFGG